MVLILRILFCFCLFISKSIASLPSPGRFTFTLNSYQEFGAVVKNVYKGATIYMKIQCESDKISDSRIDDKSYINVGWVLRESKCWNEYAHQLIFTQHIITSQKFALIYQNIVSITQIMSDLTNQNINAKTTEKTIWPQVCHKMKYLKVR